MRFVGIYSREDLSYSLLLKLWPLQRPDAHSLSEIICEPYLYANEFIDRSQ